MELFSLSSKQTVMNTCVYSFDLASDQITNPTLIFPQHGNSDMETVLNLSYTEQISL